MRILGIPQSGERGLAVSMNLRFLRILFAAITRILPDPGRD